MSKQILIGAAAAVSTAVLSPDLSRTDLSLLDLLSISTAYAQQEAAGSTTNADQPSSPAATLDAVVGQAPQAPSVQHDPAQQAAQGQPTGNSPDPQAGASPLPPSPSILQYTTVPAPAANAAPESASAVPHNAPNTPAPDQPDITATFTYVNALDMVENTVTLLVPPKPANGERDFQLLHGVVYTLASPYNLKSEEPGTTGTLLDIPIVRNSGASPISAVLEREQKRGGGRRSKIVREPLTLSVAEEGLKYVRIDDQLYQLKEVQADGKPVLLPIDQFVPYQLDDVRNRGDLVATMEVVMPDGASTRRIPVEPSNDGSLPLLSDVLYSLSNTGVDPALSARFYLAEVGERPEYGIGRDTTSISPPVVHVSSSDDPRAQYTLHRVFFELGADGKPQRLDGADLQTRITVLAPETYKQPITIQGDQTEYVVTGVQEGKAKLGYLLKAAEQLPPVEETEAADTYIDLGFVQLTYTETMVALGVIAAAVAGGAGGAVFSMLNDSGLPPRVPTQQPVSLTGLNND